jgi:hypothetical protein
VRHLISMTLIILLSDFLFCLQYIIAYPISRGKIVNFVAFKTQYDLENSKYNGAWLSFTDKSDLVKIFRGWESEVQALVDVCLKFK